LLHEEIFKRDSKGQTRTWRMESVGGSYRTIAGILGGQLVESGWTVCEGKNVGRSNETTPEQQALLEVASAYEHKLTREYHRDVNEIGKGAHFFKPMLAKEYTTFAPGFAQPKLDGVRCIVTVDGMFSRQGKPIAGAPHIFEALAPLFDADEDLILDGELYNHDLKDDFNTIISLVRKANPSAAELETSAKMVQYHVYDMPSHDAHFPSRITAVARLFLNSGIYSGAAPTGPIRIVPTVPANTAEKFDHAHGAWLEAGYEGSMWRAGDAMTRYEQKRSKHLLKRKEFQDKEFPCLRIEEGLGNWAGLAKRVVFQLPDGRECGAGIRGNMQRAKELLSETHKEVTVRYFALTPDGVPRFPVVTAFHGEGRQL